MDAKLYVYAYVVLSALYAAGCLQYVNALTRTTGLAKGLRAHDETPSHISLDSEEVRESTKTAVRSVLAIDSAAFGAAVLPVAYVAVTGVLANVISRNSASAGAINPVWLLATVALVVAHMVFLARIVGLNSTLKTSDDAVLSPSFVSRHGSMLSYYRWFILAVTIFNVVNTLYIVGTIDTVANLPYVGF